MILDPRIAQLLLRWEELRGEGQTVSPEELCRDCPELLHELVRGLHGMQTTCHSLDSTPQERDLSAEPLPSPVGMPVIGDFQILGTLGQGGMGVVYQAWDRKRKEMIALKTLQRVNASTIYRLKQEFRALTEVTHPNLVGLYELISTGQQCFVAMELIEGDHFLSGIRRKAEGVGGLTPHQYDHLRKIFRQLAQGVSALHSHGKLHRDIKPSNVMVTREGRVVLLDFGLVAEMDWAGQHQSTAQNVAGTIDYMAPEQAASQPQSEATDWYSVGVILYEALTGQLPFVGTPLQVLMDKQSREPPAPGELMPDVPEDLNSLCVDLLRKSAETRPKGTEVLRRLGELPSLNDASTIGHSVSTQRASFVGREAQLAELHGAFHAMRKGRTTVVRLQGRSGAGKSLLAQHFLDDLLQQGEAVVLAGKCYERESVPYKALDSLIDSLSRYLRHLPSLEAQALLPREPQLLARVFPVLQRVPAIAEAPSRGPEIVDPHELRRRAFAALRELLARLGDRKPLVVFIDDLQWGDLDGATQLVELLRQPEAPVFMLLASFRSEDADTSPCLEILHRALDKAGADLDQLRLSVDQLGHDEACELALNLLGRRDAASLAEANTIARESGGNPFFVQVLVECSGTSLQHAAASSAAGTRALDEILWSRIQALPDEPRRLLEVIAVSGQPLGREEACKAANLGTDEYGTLAGLRSARLIRSSGSTEKQDLETYHDRIRETILSHLSTDSLQTLHLRIATVLELAVRSLDPGDGHTGMTGLQGRPDQDSFQDGPGALSYQLENTGSQTKRDVSGVEPVTLPIFASDNTSEAATSSSMKELSSKRIFDLAYHFDAAGDSERAFPYAMAMADNARVQYALEIAEQLYRIAERGSKNAEDATRYRVAVSLGDVLMLAGRYPDAALRFKAALSLTTNRFTRAETEGKLGELAFKQGDNRATCEILERSLRTLGRRIPSRTAVFALLLVWEVLVQALHTLLPRLFLARRHLHGADEELLAIRLYTRLAYGYFFDRGKVPCLWAHLRSVNLAERYPSTLELGHVWATHAPVMSLLPWLSRGEMFAKKSLEIRRELGDVLGQGQSLHYLGIVYFVGARYDECISVCREAVGLLEQTGDYWEINVARYAITNALYRRGDLTGAIKESQQLYNMAIEMGDDKVSGFVLDVWSRASGGRLPADIMRREMQKERHDVQATAQVLLAEAVRLIAQDELTDAENILLQARKVCGEVGMMNAWVSPVLPWLATTRRMQWERSSDLAPHHRHKLLLSARKVARQALSVARKFETDLPHALRECGLIAALQGQIRTSRQYFDESLAVAERQGARFEHGQTLLARGQVGQHNDWPEARQDLTTARKALLALGAEVTLDSIEKC